MKGIVPTVIVSLALITLHISLRSFHENRDDPKTAKDDSNTARLSTTGRKILQIAPEIIVPFTLDNSNRTAGGGPTTAPSSSECYHLHYVNHSSRCKFVLSNDDCDLSDGFIQYVHFAYCDLPNLLPLSLVLLFFWLLFLFVVLGVTADDYFCPSLSIISQTLKMSQNVAGVTFLAYGNGAPDIFSAIAAFSHTKEPGAAQLGIQALFGAGIFVTTVVVGSVTLCTGGFTLNNRPFIRDVLFYLGAVAWMFITMYKENITTLEAIGFIIFYVAYVLVVIIGRFVNQRWKKKKKAAKKVVTVNVDEDDLYSSPIDASETDPLLPSSITNDPLLPTPIITLPKRSTTLPPFRKLIHGITPFTSAEFELSGILNKAFLIFKAPAVLLLNLTIPVVFFDEPDQNWNKWLNVLHLITAPMFGVLATQVSGTLIGGRFPVWALTLSICVVLATVVIMMTSHNQPPRFHWMYGYLAFIVSVIWIYVTANEIVNILQTFGIALSLSNGILGLTFLAWGNSIGDLVADTTMARQGFPNMAVGACFGGPMLNLLLGIGVACTMASVAQGHPVMLTHRYHQYLVSAGFLAASLASSAIVIPLRGFRLTRGYGLYLLVLYLAYITLSIVVEVKHL